MMNCAMAALAGLVLTPLGASLQPITAGKATTALARLATVAGEATTTPFT
jgi:hypothetical protein